MVSVTEARVRMAELVNRVVYGGETIFLCRHGQRVAMLTPLAPPVSGQECAVGDVPVERVSAL